MDLGSVVDTGLPLEHDATTKAGFYETVQDEVAPAADEIALEAEENTSNERFAERIRQRSEETTNEYKTLPRFNYKYSDCDDFKLELNEWFDTSSNSDNTLGDAKFQFSKSFQAETETGNQHSEWKKASPESKQEFVKSQLSLIHSQNDYTTRYQALLNLGYIALGTYGEVSTVGDHVSQIIANCKLLWSLDSLRLLYERFQQLADIRCPKDLTAVLDPELNTDQLDAELMQVMTIIYVMLESLRTRVPEFTITLGDLNPSILGYLVEVFGRLRWSAVGQLPVRHVLLLTWKCILCLFGGSETLESTKSYMRKQLGLAEKEATSTEDDLSTSTKTVPKNNNNNSGSSIAKDSSTGGLPQDPQINASPLDYHAFRKDLISRYPDYTPPPSVLPEIFDNENSISHYIQVPRPNHKHTQNASLPAPTVHIATPAPSPPSSPAIAAGQKVKKSVFMTNQSFPFLYPTEQSSVPQSIQEAGELFASRIKTTPAMVQLWQERDKFMQHERGWLGDQANGMPEDEHGQAGPRTSNENGDCSNGTSTINGDSKPQSTNEQNILDRVEQFYRHNHQNLSSFVNALLNIMLDATKFTISDDSCESIRSKEINLKSISAIFLLLSRWFRVSHVLKFEYFSAILFDSRYYLLVYKFLYSHTPLDRALYSPDMNDMSFFAQCRDLSDNAATEPPHAYGQTAMDDHMISPNEAQYVDSVDIFSSRYLFTIVNFMRVLRKIINEKTQRIIVVAELPSETLKKTLTIYQKDLWKNVLDIFKEQVPFNGRRWKYNNMDLVSAIYLHCKPKLRDDWLVGYDVTAEVDDACAQEVALRALTQFYNDRMYSKRSSEPDFFEHELESLSLS